MAGSELRQLGPSTWVLEGPTNIGFITQSDGIYLVDSGNDKESGRKINQILKERNWTLQAVINTHSNADHIGGNDYLQRNLGCRIFSSPLESAFTEHPRLEAAFLWGGMEVKDLRNKFFLAKPSRVTDIVTDGLVIGDNIGSFPIPGHYFDMIGLESPDNCLFVADSLFGEDILEKYKIPFIFDVKAYRNSIELIAGRPGAYFIPSHGNIVDNARGLIDSNLAVLDKLEADLMAILGEKKSFDYILSDICRINGIKLNHGQFALVGSTIRSFLSFLYNEGKIRTQFEDNILYWQGI
ncbi:MBL fold metallo-hydrolase [Spirochaeta isovalerica]|uniref:Glyoxylase-like metal-dependent hydrolase (Beta-lactamase superfamily II) n=1 Tax=Spirochaeta isovalerica TaxID=150 RepID=A0A841RFD7_9SPIO|nr:MBL fold metallo-hydrolase [Spirochaeta isovalerica]MBB6481298.1 glyoxylase-like metal-dependent hydrolase (beta-lactamase superfamily II) [Spirochaeta isovalerica]